ncbi:MAG: CsgG/HfaB family protein [Treponema sp.]|jgi:hypothetical protein|nr:CsgG/HfaB family protein [Treponema sp.]
MKGNIFLLCLSVLVLLLGGCGTVGAFLSGDGGNTDPMPSFEEGAQNTDPAGQARTVPYFEGDGGKGLRIAVLLPDAKGLAESEQWLPALVQGTLTGDFNKFSAMTISDRQNLEKILAEQTLSAGGNFSEDDYIRMGALVNAQYLLAGSITKTGAGFMLELSVSDTEQGVRKASYPPVMCSLSELTGMTAIKAASEELLSQMGVQLTDAGLTALRGVKEREADAEVALSKGITAQKSGTVVAALNYYSYASSLNTGLAESDLRLAALTKRIESGDIGENVRNDIEQRNAWIKLLEEAISFYQGNPYYNLVYYVKPKVGETNYRTETAPVLFDIWLEPNDGYSTMLKIVRALMSTGMAEKWGLTGKIVDLLQIGQGFVNVSYGYIFFAAELLSEQGDYLAEGRGRAGIITPTAPSHYDNHMPAAAGPVILQGNSYQYNPISFMVDAKQISNGMRLSDIRILNTREEVYSPGSDFRAPRLPFIGAMRIIPSEKPIDEYFRGKRGVERASTGQAKFVFR